jgi:FkbM family methyltransferase
MYRTIKIIYQILLGRLHHPYTKWLLSNKSKHLLKDIILNENSLVIDGGAFKGEFTARILQEFNCKVHCFEPIPSFANSLIQRFKQNSNVTVYDLALGNKDTVITISVDENASGTYAKSKNSINVKSIDITTHIDSCQIKKIDLLKLNLEGAEYDILDKLITENRIHLVDALLVQFHDFVPNHNERYKNLYQNLVLTHKLEWQYEFVWELWKLK